MAPALTDLLDEIKSVEPLPQVAMRVVELGAQDDVAPSDLMGVIQTDAGLTAKVLKLCNSAFYGFRREIASLPEAGNLLGVNTLVNLVLTSCAGRYFRNYGNADSIASLRLWEASIATAFATSTLAARQGNVDKNRAYTLGLLENIGHLVLTRFVVDGASELTAQLERGTERLEAERVAYGLDHAEIGAQLAARWNFPELLVDSIRYHHRPEESPADPALAAVGHVGELIPRRLELAGPCRASEYYLDARALRRLGIDQKAIEDLRTPLVSALENAKKVLALA